jgi:tripartite-type tricarboxylate transporter receptor subunit TctC
MSRGPFRRRVNWNSFGVTTGHTMKLARRKFLHPAAGASAMPALPRIARAQAFPSRPITMIVPFAVGGASDVIARIVNERMRKSLGQSIIIENVGGADGTIGTGRAARAKPDGYTIINGLMESQVLNGAFYSLPYDALDDFTPISPLVTFPYLLFTKKTISAANVNELVDLLKANPGNASAGIGNIGLRLLTAFFQKETGTQVTFVPYRGVAPAMQDLLAGQIDLMFTGPEQLPLMRAGSVKAYAVSGHVRLAAAPDIPTFREMGLPALSYTTWAGAFAPKRTPKDVISKLNAAAVDALADPAVRSRFVDLGMEIVPRERQTPEALGALVKADAEKWWPISKELGVKAE